MRIDGFDLGNSPREYLEARTPTLAISTTNGTRAIVTAAERCERVLIASLLNLAAVTEEARSHGDDVAMFCAGVRAHSRSTTLRRGPDCHLLGGELSDAAEAAVRLAASYPTAEEALRASRSGRNLIDHGAELEADIAYCAQESVLAVVPRLTGRTAWRRRSRVAATSAPSEPSDPCDKVSQSLVPGVG